MSTVKQASSISFGGFDTSVSLSASVQGYVVLDKESERTRLHFFDGKFLRATDLQLEQNALLKQVQLSNQAQGGGLEYGFDFTQVSDSSIKVSAGLGFDWQGRVLSLSQDVELNINNIIAQTSLPSLKASVEQAASFAECEISAPLRANGTSIEQDELYLIMLYHVEAHCGEEDVYGKLCSQACVGDTQRPYIVEGIEIKAVPLNLSVALKQSIQVEFGQKHERSRIVSAFFAQEQNSKGSLISQQGLSANSWCLGADQLGVDGIAIGILSKRGDSIRFIDAWGARRERMESPSKQYWAGRMGMRSWPIFLAQILQFQCQLRDCLNTISPDDNPITGDPCAEEKALIKVAANDMQALLSHYSNVSKQLTELDRITGNNLAQIDLESLQANIGRLQAVGEASISNQMLIDCGIVELPSGGYLPVVPSTGTGTTDSINAQVRRLMGSGVNLRFCVVRPDFVHHALEEAQHMERICLTNGLEEAQNRPNVDILVPQGVLSQGSETSELMGFQSHLDSSDTMVGMMLHLVASSFIDELEEGSINDSLVINTTRSFREAYATINTASAKTATAATANVKAATTVNVSEMNSVRDSNGLLDFGGEMTGSARAETDQGKQGFYVAAENSASTNIDNIDVNTSLSFWGQMNSELPIFGLLENQRTQLSSRFLMDVDIAYVTEKEVIDMQVIIDLNTNGQLIVEQKRQLGKQTILNCRFIGDSVLRYNTIANGEAKSQVSSVSLLDTLTITKTETEFGDNLEIIVPSPALFGNFDLIELVYTQTWNAAGECAVSGVMKSDIDDTNPESSFLSGKFVPNANALKAGNVFHSKSLNALGQIAQALKNPGFVDSASYLLFPPPIPSNDSLVVRSSYPWVLFHRRRDKACEPSVIPEAPLAQRTYQIYRVELNPDVDVHKYLSVVQRDFSSAVSQAQAILQVEFAANSSNLNTSQQMLQQAWSNNANDGEQVIITAIASQGEVLSEGEDIASARVSSINGPLSSVASLIDNLPLHLEQSVPDSLQSSANAGAIVYFVQALSVQTNCHDVYQVLIDDPDKVGAVIENAIERHRKSPESVNLDSLLNNDISRQIDAKPRFTEGTANFVSADEASNLRDEWNRLGNYMITHAGSLFAEQAPATQASASLQSQTIVTNLGGAVIMEGDNRNFASIAVPSTFLGSCQRASILVSAIQAHEVYIVASNAREIDLIAGAKVDSTLASELTSVLIDEPIESFQPAYYSLSTVDFYWDRLQMEAKSEESAVSVWREYLAANEGLLDVVNNLKEINAVSVVNASDDSDGNLTHKPSSEIVIQQSNTFIGKLGMNVSIENDAILVQKEDFPSASKVITFIAVEVPVASQLTVSSLAASVRFAEDNSVLVDDKFIAAAKRLVSGENAIGAIEIVSEEDTPEALKAAEEKARNLKKALQDNGAANRLAKVTVTAPTANVNRDAAFTKLTLK